MSSERFFEEFRPTDLSNDPLPLKVINHSIDNSELNGQAVYWAFQYLYQKNCPSELLTPLLKRFMQLLASTELSDCIQQSNDLSGGGDFVDSSCDQKKSYQPLKLMQTVTTMIDQVCLEFKGRSSEDEVDNVDETSGVHEISFCSMKNTRRSLEDRMIILPNMNTIYNSRFPASYFAVFDGHNGVEAAAYAAAQLHQNLISDQDYPNDITSAINSAFKRTNSEFLGKCSKDNMRSGATAVIALVTSPTIYVAWAGDSQAILVNDSGTTSLVSPHKPERQDEMDRIKKRGGEVLLLSGTWRVNGNLAVSRAIGDYDYKDYIISTPEFRTVERNGTEEFLVIACDGLWDDISPQRCAQIIKKHLIENGRDLDGLSQRLASEAKKEGCSDNITIIVVFLQPVGMLINKYNTEPVDDSAATDFITDERENQKETAQNMINSKATSQENGDAEVIQLSSGFEGANLGSLDHGFQSNLNPFASEFVPLSPTSLEGRVDKDFTCEDMLGENVVEPQFEISPFMESVADVPSILETKLSCPMVGLNEPAEQVFEHVQEIIAGDSGMVEPHTTTTINPSHNFYVDPPNNTSNTSDFIMEELMEEEVNTAASPEVGFGIGLIDVDGQVNDSSFKQETISLGNPFNDEAINGKNLEIFGAVNGDLGVTGFSDFTDQVQGHKLEETKSAGNPFILDDTQNVELNMHNVESPNESFGMNKSPLIDDDVAKLVDNVVIGRDDTNNDIEVLSEPDEDWSFQKGYSDGAAEPEKRIGVEKTPEPEGIVHPEKMPEPEKLAESEKMPEPEKLAESEKMPELEKLAESEKMPEPEKLAESEKISETEKIAELNKITEAEKIMNTSPLAMSPPNAPPPNAALRILPDKEKSSKSVTNEKIKSEIKVKEQTVKKTTVTSITKSGTAPAMGVVSPIKRPIRSAQVNGGKNPAATSTLPVTKTKAAPTALSPKPGCSQVSGPKAPSGTTARTTAAKTSVSQKSTLPAKTVPTNTLVAKARPTADKSAPGKTAEIVKVRSAVSSSTTTARPPIATRSPVKKETSVDGAKKDPKLDAAGLKIVVPKESRPTTVVASKPKPATAPLAAGKPKALPTAASSARPTTARTTSGAEKVGLVRKPITTTNPTEKKPAKVENKATTAPIAKKTVLKSGAIVTTSSGEAKVGGKSVPSSTNKLPASRQTVPKSIAKDSKLLGKEKTTTTKKVETKVEKKVKKITVTSTVDMNNQEVAPVKEQVISGGYAESGNLIDVDPTPGVEASAPLCVNGTNGLDAAVKMPDLLDNQNLLDF